MFFSKNENGKSSNWSPKPTLRVVPYTALIDRGLLRAALLFSKFKKITLGISDTTTLTSDHKEQYVRSLVTQDDVTEINSKTV